MDFYQKTGKMALGSRLRRLSELLTDQAAEVYSLYQVNIQPKWFPVFYVLSPGAEKTISQIAREIGQSHPSVSVIVKEMKKHGVLSKGDNQTDKRENYVKLTEKGFEINERIQVQYTDVESAIEKAIAETQSDLWKAIEEWEFILNKKSLLKRVGDEKKLREGKHVTIVDYEPGYKQAFKELNEEWITRYFKMEASDYKYLDYPQENILDKNGVILFALAGDKPVGTCALVETGEQVFELAKMAVADEAKGKGIGYLLGLAAVERARALGAKKLFLESNTRLEPAINLYQKLGFRRIFGQPSPYERSNIQMELIL